MHRRFENDPSYSDEESSEQEQQIQNGKKMVKKENGAGIVGEGDDGLLISETGFCALCNKTSVCKCERCGDFYCSPQCQRKDWPNHRFICFPMPRLIKAKAGGSEHHSHHSMLPLQQRLPILKAEANSIEMSKEEKREAYKARQLSFIPAPTPMPKDGSIVILTGVKSANRCYIRSADPAISTEYENNLKKIDNYGKQSSELFSLPKANTFAVAQWNDKWCRIQILSPKSDNRARVHFIDYGIISIVNVNELKRIGSSVSSLPNFVHMIQLHGVTRYSMQQPLIQKISENVDMKFKMQIVGVDEIGGNVELFHIDTNKLFNEEVFKIHQELKENEHISNTSTMSNDVDNEVEMAKQNDQFQSTAQTAKYMNGTPGKKAGNQTTNKTSQESIAISPSGSATKKNIPKQIQRQQPCFIPPFKTIPFQSNAKDVNVIIVDSSNVEHGYLGCLLEKDVDNLKGIQAFLQDFDFPQSPYKPKVDEYCIAEFEKEWYRAKVIDVLGEDEFYVAYIDFTNECALPSASIRRYPMSLTLSCCSHLCGIEGIPAALSEDFVEFLKTELSLFKKIRVNRIFEKDEILYVECKDLLKKLHEKNFI